MTGTRVMLGVLNFLAGGVLHPLVIGLFLVLVLEPRWPKLPHAAPAAILPALMFVPSILRVVLYQNAAVFRAMEVLNMLAILGVLLICFRDGLLKKALALALTVVGLGMTQVFAYAMLDAMGIGYRKDFYNWGMFAVLVMTVSISMILYGVFALLWNKIIKRETFSRRNAVFLLFPISQMMMMWYVSHVPIPYQITPLSVGSILVGLVGELVLFYIVFMQNRQAALEKMLSEVNAAWKMEQKTYAAMEKHREHTEKIRHDMKNQLTAALFLMKQNDIQEARSILEGVKGAIQQSEEATLCPNPVINAVMMEKAADCRKVGIRLDADLPLPQDLHCEAIYLCSSFSNLMDNAIAAAAQCSPDARSIQIHAAKIGDYLHVKVVNTAPAPRQKEKREGHGYGLMILQDIARRHNGEFSGSWAGGMYTAMLTLEIPAPAQTAQTQQ